MKCIRANICMSGGNLNLNLPRLEPLEPLETPWTFRFQGSLVPCKGRVLGTGAGIDGAK